MSYERLLRNVGFDSDPFAQTNADEEERLADYFISPPFFTAVYGQPSNPKSSFVFAPRGGGKTALKRRIEISSSDTDFLCVTYNYFPIAGMRINDVTADYHLTNIVRLVLVAVITAVEARKIGALDKTDKQLLYLLTRDCLSTIERGALKSAVDSVKSFGDSAKEFWNAYTGPIGLALSALFAKFGLGAAEIKRVDQSGAKTSDNIERLAALKKIAQGLGYKSIYVLIDKVDETAITGKASTSYEFISPIAADLQLLELSGYAFKFFLWDLLRDDYKKVARPDRIKYYSLEWSEDQLKEMLSRRLAAFSSGRISTLDSIVEDAGKTADVDQLVAMFAQGSPRKMIRICKEIFDQQSELSFTVDKISSDAFIAGVEKIAESLASEEFEAQQLRDLKRNKRIDFTIRHVYLNAFKFTQQAGMNKVKSWEDSGAVQFLGTIQDTQGAKASNHYGVSNVLLAKHIFMELDVFDFAAKKIRRCDSCGKCLLRDWDVLAEHRCHSCQTVVKA